MKLWKKLTLGTIITTGLVAGVKYALGLKHTSAELETQTKVMVHKMDFEGLTLRVDTVIKNPSKTELKIKYPFVKLIYKDSTIGSSQVQNQDVVIPAYGEARIEKILFQIPLLGLFSIGGELFKSLQSKETIAMQVKIITTIDLGWKKLPFEKTQEVKIQA